MTWEKSSYTRTWDQTHCVWGCWERWSLSLWFVTQVNSPPDSWKKINVAPIFKTAKTKEYSRDFSLCYSWKSHSQHPYFRRPAVAKTATNCAHSTSLEVHPQKLHPPSHRHEGKKPTMEQSGKRKSLASQNSSVWNHLETDSSGYKVHSILSKEMQAKKIHKFPGLWPRIDSNILVWFYTVQRKI